MAKFPTPADVDPNTQQEKFLLQQHLITELEGFLCKPITPHKKWDDVKGEWKGQRGAKGIKKQQKENFGKLLKEIDNMINGVDDNYVRCATQAFFTKEDSSHLHRVYKEKVLKPIHDSIRWFINKHRKLSTDEDKLLKTMLRTWKHDTMMTNKQFSQYVNNIYLFWEEFNLVPTPTELPTYADMLPLAKVMLNFFLCTSDWDGWSKKLWKVFIPAVEESKFDLIGYAVLSCFAKLKYGLDDFPRKEQLDNIFHPPTENPKSQAEYGRLRKGRFKVFPRLSNIKLEAKTIRHILTGELDAVDEIPAADKLAFQERLREEYS